MKRTNAVVPFVFAAAVMAANAQSALDSAGIVSKVSPAVVLIKGASSDGTILGSGMIVSRDGKIATNLHVIRDLKTAGVQLASGEIFDTVTILAFDERKDIAIIKISGFDLPIVELGNSSEVTGGEPVVAIGSPRGLQGTVTTGVVSAIRDEPSGAGFKVIQTDAAVNPGNSGGPLLNARGQAVGIVTAKLRGSEGLNFAVPINYVRGTLENLQKPVSLDELRTSLGVTRTDVFKSSAGYPSLWKSLVSGAVWRLRFEGDFAYAERVMSHEEREIALASWELKKGQDGTYTGVTRNRFVCSYTSTWTGLESNRCTFENRVEFTSVTPGRIEGRAFVPPDGARLDCRKCSYSKPSAGAAPPSEKN
jgi:hypothetical protein